MLKGRRDIFGHFRQRSEVFGKSSEICERRGDVSMPVIKRRKTQAFDSDKVGR